MMASKTENSARIRELLNAGKLEEALAFTDNCIKGSSDMEFYLGWKLELLNISRKLDKALECALMLEKVSEGKKVSSAFKLAELHLQNKNYKQALYWMAQAAERGLKDDRFFSGEEWATVRKDAQFKSIQKRVMDNQGIGKPAPDFSVKLIWGDDFNLSKMIGKVVLIDFWATWCKPCVKAIPAMKECYQKFNKQGFEIIAVSLDRDIKQLKDYLTSEKIPWMVSFSGQEWGQDKTANLYEVNMIPTTFLVDKKGRVRYYNLKKGNFEQAIQVLLDE
jgi:peroxiredoxin